MSRLIQRKKLKYRLSISYNGFFYCGSQQQLDKITVQSEIEAQLKKKFFDLKNCVFSGRTDAGVHAIDQKIDFISTVNIPTNNLKLLLNRSLGDKITVNDCSYVTLDKHCRFDAYSRTYQYTFSNDKIPFELLPFCSKINFIPDENVMQNLSSIIKGQHDFVGFRKLGSNEKSTIREVYHVEFNKESFKPLYESQNFSHYYTLHIKANSFLYRMVRNLVGAIFEVLKGRYTTLEFKKYLDGELQEFNYIPAEAKGLCLVQVRYQGEKK
eukprot:COSAG01_NODE_1_length_100484_cov_170.446142_64_plen_268_part_00